MGAELTLVSNRGRRLNAPVALGIEAGSDPLAAAFLQTMETALRQAQRLMERSEQQPARLRKLAQAVQDHSRDILSLSADDAQWTIEPFVGA